MLYVPDVDAAFQRAIDAGATAIMPPADMFWGDRFGTLADPFGHQWSMATHKEDLSREEIHRRGAAAMAAMGTPGRLRTAGTRCGWKFLLRSRLELPPGPSDPT